MTALAFVDTETTGLDPVVSEHLWHLPVDLSRADPIALNIGRFHDRYRKNGVNAGPEPSSLGAPRQATLSGELAPMLVNEFQMESWAREFVRLTRGAHLVGAVVSFDAERLWRLLRLHGQCPMWHYHICDCEALAAGHLGIAPPWGSNELSRLLGIDAEEFDRHTAMGDARWARAMFDAVMTLAGNR